MQPISPVKFVELTWILKWQLVQMTCTNYTEEVQIGAFQECGFSFVLPATRVVEGFPLSFPGALFPPAFGPVLLVVA